MIRLGFRWVVRLVLISLLLLLGITIVAPSSVLPPLASYLDDSDPPTKVDYVLILNGDPDVRPYAAAALMKAGLAKGVLLTRQRLALESQTVREGVMPSELEITQHILIRQGVDKKAIEVLPGEIGSTADEAKRLAEFLEDKPDASVVVVTNDFHVRRARWIIERQLGSANRRITLLGVPQEDGPRNLVANADGMCGVRE